MKTNLYVTDHPDSKIWHKEGRKCSGRFAATDYLIYAIDDIEMKVYSKSNFTHEETGRLFKDFSDEKQEFILLSLCKKCCKSFIEKALELTNDKVKEAYNRQRPVMVKFYRIGSRYKRN